MNWKKLNSFVQNLLNFPGCILVFITCGSATIGILYLKNPFEFGFQYMPAIAALAYFLSRSLFALQHGLHISRNEVIGYAFVLSTAIAMAIQLSLQLDALDMGGRSSLDFTLSMWIFSMFYFFAGAACNRTVYRKSDIVALFLLLMVFIPFLTTPKQGLFVDYYALRQATGMAVLTHLTIAEWCVFFFIGAFAFSSKKMRPVVMIVAFVCLFGMQGRSSTFFTLFTFLSFWVLTEGKKVVLIYALVAAVSALAFMVLPLGEMLSGSNTVALDRMLLDSGDNSLQGRNAGLWSAIEHLPKSMLFGDPTYIAIEAGDMGGYIHNVLSMWQFFGLLPFILIVIILVRSLLSMKSRIARGNLNVMEEMACMLLIYSSVCMIFAKSVNFYWVWFAAGYWILQYSGSSTSSRRKPERKRRSKRRRSRKTTSSTLPTGDFRF